MNRSNTGGRDPVPVPATPTADDQMLAEHPLVYEAFDAYEAELLAYRTATDIWELRAERGESGKWVVVCDDHEGEPPYTVGRRGFETRAETEAAIDALDAVDPGLLGRWQEEEEEEAG